MFASLDPPAATTAAASEDVRRRPDADVVESCDDLRRPPEPERSSSSPSSPSEEFWAAAHASSCLRRGSLSSSIADVVRDVEATEAGDGVEARVAAARDALGRGEVCARIDGDGIVWMKSGVVGDGDGGDSRPRVALCLRPPPSAAASRSSSSSSSPALDAATDSQLDAVAGLSAAWLVDDGRGRRRRRRPDPARSREESSRDASAADDRRGWFGELGRPASLLRRGLDWALDVFEGGDDDRLRFEAAGVAELDEDDATASAKRLLARDVASAVRVVDADDDDRGATGAAPASGEDRELGDADEVVNLKVVAEACRRLLEFAKEVATQGEDEAFFVCGHDGVERVVLARTGQDAGSFGSFCREAGKKLAAADGDGAHCMYAQILSNASEREADLLARTLRESGRAHATDDVATLFPAGAPAGYEQSQADRALFQIHAAKVAVRRRIVRLERDVASAKAGALEARRKGHDGVAVANARRHKALRGELDRCAATLANLDAGSLRLERARDEAAVAKGYDALRTALRDAREFKDRVGDAEDLEGLMDDLREEMDAAGDDVADIGEALVDSSELAADDELREEFERLELQCEGERRAGDAERGPAPDAAEASTRIADAHPPASAKRSEGRDGRERTARAVPA